MSIVSEEKYGTIKVSDDVIAICAMNAALKTEGVADLNRVIADSISTMLGKESLHRGVRVTQIEEELALDIYVIVKYGVKIPEVAWNIQENVKKQVEHMVDLPVKAVNIHVQGVAFSENTEEK